MSESPSDDVVNWADVDLLLAAVVFEMNLRLNLVFVLVEAACFHAHATGQLEGQQGAILGACLRFFLNLVGRL